MGPAGLSQIALKPFNKKVTSELFTHGFRELRNVAKELAERVDLIRFLWGFFVLSMALQTIMLMASSFGIKEVNLADDQLIVAIIAVQLLSIPGAFFVSWVSGKVGNIRTLIGCLVVWMGVCVYAYSLVNDVNGFFVAAGVIGFMMGGTQSLNRSSYSKMLPSTEDHASYFSFMKSWRKAASSSACSAGATSRALRAPCGPASWP